MTTNVHVAGYFWGDQSNAGASVSAEEKKVIWLVRLLSQSSPCSSVLYNSFQMMDGLEIICV